ncbi:hypothetical protein OIU79_007357 [Salix purpurea]|uniref:Uncharacterized protein n=1 Tax=Salix purpurea TaxID=77065 RepID=A0A9Q0Z3D3_SALPP|nr:hypothetical protein OIU79_007357 [Salix purpurea]
MRLGLLSDRSPLDANSDASLQKTVSNIVSRSDVLQGNLGGICLWLCNCCIFKLGRTNGFSCTEQSSWWAIVATQIKDSFEIRFSKQSLQQVKDDFIEPNALYK